MGSLPAAASVVMSMLATDTASCVRARDLGGADDAGLGQAIVSVWIAARSSRAAMAAFDRSCWV